MSESESILKDIFDLYHNKNFTETIKRSKALTHKVAANGTFNSGAHLRQQSDIWQTYLKDLLQFSVDELKTKNLESHFISEENAFHKLLDQEKSKALEQLKTIISTVSAPENAFKQLYGEFEISITAFHKGWDLEVSLQKKIKKKGENEAPTPGHIFLSHSSAESAIAMKIKSLLNELFNGISIFCSSDPKDIKAGANWQEVVFQNLHAGDVILVLATKSGVSKPWVWFELGLSWFKNCKIIPLCCGPLKKGSLPVPINSKQGKNIDELEDLKEFISDLGECFGQTVTPPSGRLENFIQDLHGT